MAWSFTAHRGSANNKVSGTVLAVSPSAQIPAGAIALAVAVSDNIATGGGATANHVVTDFRGNLWTKVREQSNAAAAGAGITLSVWVSQLATALQTSDSVVLGLSAAATAKAIGLYEYAIGAGNFFDVSGSNGTQQDGTASPTVTLGSLSSTAYAFFGVVAREDDTAGTYTPDADFNDRTKFGTTGGTPATNVSCIVGDRLATLTGDTFNPTALQASADVCSILIAFREIAPFRQTVDDVDGSGGTVRIRFGKTTMEFSTLEQAKQFATFSAGEGQTVLRRLALARYLAIDPTASNPAVMEGHSIAFTDQLNRMVEVF